MTKWGLTGSSVVYGYADGTRVHKESCEPTRVFRPKDPEHRGFAFLGTEMVEIDPHSQDAPEWVREMLERD